MRPLALLLLLSALSFLPSSGLSGQTYTTFTGTSLYLSTQTSTAEIGETTFSELTTSTYSYATGTVQPSYISDTDQQICYYLYYPFHVDGSVQKIIGSVSASTPVNLFLMSEAQYDDFVNQNLPCGSSYHALYLDYLRRSFAVDWTLDPGDYYLILENISQSTVTYSVQISAIEYASSAIYSTEQIIQLFTSSIRYVSDVTTQPVSTTAQSSPESYGPITVFVAVFAALVLLIYRHRQQNIPKDEGTRVY
jgi:hypothetical protein